MPAPTEEDWRPALARLGERILKQEITDYTKLFEAAVGAAKNPPQGSTWEADLQTAKGNEAAEAALAYASEQFARLCTSVHDHAEVLLLLMGHKRLLFVPAWTNARAILEPVLMMCWLTDREVDSETRITRAMSLLPGIIEGTIKQLAKFPDRDQELQEKRAAREDLVAYYARHGVETIRQTDKKNRPLEAVGSLRFQGRRAPLEHNITQLAERYLPDDPYLYGMLSGATHSKLWLLNGLSDDADEAIRAVLAPLIPVSEAYTRALCSYLGIDSTEYMTKHRRRLIALMERGSSPAAVDRSSRPTAFGQFQRGLRLEEITRRH